MRRFNLYGFLQELNPGDQGSGGGGSNPDGKEPNPTPGEEDPTKTRDQDIDDKDLDPQYEEKFSSIEEELKSLREDKQKREQAEVIKTAVSGIKKEFPSFDENKIKAKLQEIKNDDPALAEKYNNPAGWEALHLKYFQEKDPQNDDFDLGRKPKEKFDFNESWEKSLSGDTKATRALLDNAVSTTHKY